MITNYKSRKYGMGATFETNQGYVVKIIGKDENKNGYYYVEFQDDNRHVARVNIASLNSVRNPYHRTVCEVGYIGVGEYSNKTHKKAYGVWCGMIQRCYDVNKKDIDRIYDDCDVDERWHNFQTFAEYFYKNFKEGYQLDKDLLIDGNKIYSEDTCIFIPAQINSFLGNKKSSNKSGYVGVSFAKAANKWKACINGFMSNKNINIGLYTDVEDAAKAYADARKIECEKAKVYLKELGYPAEIYNKLR